MTSSFFRYTVEFLSRTLVCNVANLLWLKNWKSCYVKWANKVQFSSWKRSIWPRFLSRSLSKYLIFQLAYFKVELGYEYVFRDYSRFFGLFSRSAQRSTATDRRGWPLYGPTELWKTTIFKQCHHEEFWIIFNARQSFHVCICKSHRECAPWSQKHSTRTLFYRYQIFLKELLSNQNFPCLDVKSFRFQVVNLTLRLVL